MPHNNAFHASPSNFVKQKQQMQNILQQNSFKWSSFKVRYETKNNEQCVPHRGSNFHVIIAFIIIKEEKIGPLIRLFSFKF